MAKKTLKEQFRFALERLGYKIDFSCRSSKYLKMSHPGKSNSYFLGTHGGLRYGRVASDSYGLTDLSRNRLLKISNLPEDKWQIIKEKYFD